jgi:hypothetical protein
MPEQPLEGASAAPSAWHEALEELEWSLRQATRAVSLLRNSLDASPAEAEPAEAAPSRAAPPLAERTLAVAPAAEPVPANGVAPDEETSPLKEAPPVQSEGTRATFDRLWDRIERERIERAEPSADEGQQLNRRRGIDLLPQQYLMTVEDREGSVDLVPLHRALLTMPGVEEITLVSYANGVPVISVRTEGELDLDLLGENVGMSMDRLCEVIPQENGKVYLRMKARVEQGANDG